MKRPLRGRAGEGRRPAVAAFFVLLVLLVLPWLAVNIGLGEAAVSPRVRVVDATTMVRQSDHPTGQLAAQLRAAQNEFESFQVAIDSGVGGNPIANVNVSLAGALTGPGGSTIPTSNITIYREAYYTVLRPSDGELWQQDPCPSNCKIPDALIPKSDPFYNQTRHAFTHPAPNAFSLNVPGGENRVAWIDILVPKGQTPGMYTGTVNVTSNDVPIADGSPVPLRLEVMNFALPSTTSLRGGFEMNPAGILDAYGDNTNNIPPTDGSGVGPWQLFQKYARAALDNRVPVTRPGYFGPVQSDSLQLARYRHFAERFLTGMYVSDVATGLGPPRLGDAGERPKTTDVLLDHNSAAGTDDWYAEATRLGVPAPYVDRISYVCDEPAMVETKWDNFCDGASIDPPVAYKLANQNWTDLSPTDLPAVLFGTIDDYQYGVDHVPAYAVDESMNTLGNTVVRMHVRPGFPAYPGQTHGGNQRDDYNAFLTGPPSGRRLWMYVACISDGCDEPSDPSDDFDARPLYSGWPSYAIDQRPSEARAMGWQIYNYKATGEFYFDTLKELANAWGDRSAAPDPCPLQAGVPPGPARPSAWGCQYYAGGNGDGTLFYPGYATLPPGVPNCGECVVGGTAGQDIPIESLRLKRIRDGREDYEYLLKAQNAIAGNETLTRAIAGGPYGSASGLFPNLYTSGTQTQAQFDDARCRLSGLARGITSIITGTAGDDTLTGTSGSDLIAGLGGSDTIAGAAGDETICGGDGFDTIKGGANDDDLDAGAGGGAVDFTGLAGPVNVNLSTGQATGQGTDTLLHFTAIYGSNGNDTLVGAEAGETLTGGSGSDSFQAGGGNDILFAQDSTADTTIDCGAGNDVAYIDSGVDTANVNCEALNPTGYARPKGASPVNLRLVPAFKECTRPDGTSADANPISIHGAPLAVPSCNPPAQSSSYLTFSAPDRASPYNAGANGMGSLTLKIFCGTAGTPPIDNGDVPPCSANAGDQQDIKFIFSLADVRCVGAAGQLSCAGGIGAAGAGSLYNGKVLGVPTIRITDRNTGASPCSTGTSCQTIVDLPFSFGAQCTGGGCNMTTSGDAVIPNVVQEQKRSIWQLGQMSVLDGGADGNLVPAPSPASGTCPPACSGNGGETQFLTQGLFVP